MTTRISTGTAFCFEGDPQPWLVEQVSPGANADTCRARLCNLAGTVVERTIGAWVDGTEPPVFLTRESFFVPQTACPFCGAASRDATPRFAVQQLFWKLQILACPACGLCYKEAFPSPALLAHIYRRDYALFAVGDTHDVSMFASRVRRMGRPRGRHLDYGCGAGSFVQAAQDAGWNSYGADPFLPSETVHGLSRDRLFRLDVADAGAAGQLGLFDCISMWAVAEHLTRPETTLRAVVSLLKPGGTLLFNAPNPDSLVARRYGSEWLLALLIEHVVFWPPSAIERLANRYGLRLQRMRICGSPFPLGRGVPSQTTQGLRDLPFHCLKCLSASNGENRSVNETKMTSRQKTQPSITTRFLLGRNLSSWQADILRRLIHGLRLGDHMEVVLERTR